jgi:hypothetical protein
LKPFAIEKLPGAFYINNLLSEKEIAELDTHCKTLPGKRLTLFVDNLF